MAEPGPPRRGPTGPSGVPAKACPWRPDPHPALGRLARSSLGSSRADSGAGSLRKVLERTSQPGGHKGAEASWPAVAICKAPRSGPAIGRQTCPALLGFD